ncbi:MAG: toprim domain-containing protein [Defluviitaleaceae bacterium]|nr:toprim domain-containing protein [Defluviitaleaceae bacterium]
MVKKTSYDNNSITSLKGADRVRKKPSVIFGSDGLLGCQHSIFEILSNSIDEAREGFGNIIEVARYKDYSIQVTDYGRGIPVDFNNTEQRYNWELVFCELYAGGKYLNNEGDSYEYSLGLNGLGLCSTQYASEYMDVSIVRDGYEYTFRFEHGENVGGMRKERTNKTITGSRIKWRPDLEVFTDIAVPIEYYLETLKRQAIVNNGLKFVFYDEISDSTFEFCYKEGIRDYIKELTADSDTESNEDDESHKKILTESQYLTGEGAGRDREDKPDYKLKFEIAFCFSNDVAKLEYYHNSSFLEYGGSPDKAVKSAFVSAIDSYIKSANLYKKDEKRLVFSDIEDSLVLILNSFSTQTSYENQTKKSISNKFIQDYLTDFLKKNLEVYFIENKADADKIAEQILINKRSRETAEKTRLNLKKKLTGSLDMTNRVEKFVDCRSKDISERELYIVEGDSALGSCKMGRDPNFQAIIPVRGKILNCLKADYDKIFKSDIITDLIKVLGCGALIKTKSSKDFSSFDLDALRWNKVIICTDADVDGFQIRALILTMLYRLTPGLIEARKVFIAESPLYEITAGKNTFFAYSDKEKNDIVANQKGSVKIQRSKGLGENDADMMWLTTMNPETRKLISVLPEDAAKTQEVFEMLLGSDIKSRKAHIEENGYKYIDLSEVV